MPTHDWRPFFPLEKPRPQQEQALDALCNLFEKGHRIMVAELGTGVGKSAVAVTFAGWLGKREPLPPEGFSPGAVVLTSQKILQDQYCEDFKHARDLRSAANFECVGPPGGSCAEGYRVRQALGKERAQQAACSDCPYRLSKDDFARAGLGVTNYSYFLSEAAYADELPLRHLLVLDEAHNVEEEVRRWGSLEVTWDDAAELGLQLPFDVKHGKALSWLRRDYRAALKQELGVCAERLQMAVEGGTLRSQAVRKVAAENELLDKRLCQVNRLFDNGGTLLVSYHEGKQKTLRVQPLEAGELAAEMLYKRASATLLMTATVLDIGIFRRSAGLPPTAPIVSIPTPFPAKSFGVNYRPIGKMSRGPKNIEAALPKLPRAIRQILKENPTEKGIVHTVNYEIARAIGENVDDPRLLVQTCAEDRDEMLRRHEESPEPTVLVSPAMMEGLDLKDELGRFQVICKIPYPMMGDPVVKKKMEEDRAWYAWRAVRTLAQAAGRCVRSEGDWTRTYILDECFLDLLDRWGHMVPRHLVEKIEVEKPF